MALSLTIEQKPNDSKTHSCDRDFVEDPETAIHMVEELRVQAGKFLYEYPSRLRRVVEVVRKE